MANHDAVAFRQTVAQSAEGDAAIVRLDTQPGGDQRRGADVYKRQRYSFWGEIYDIVLAFHLVLPTLVTMIFPKRGKFNVTDKGGLLDVGYFDFTVVRPHLVVACLLALGVIVGIVRAIGHDYFGSDPNVIALNVGWGIYSLNPHIQYVWS